MAEQHRLEFYVERYAEGDDGWRIQARSAGVVESRLTQDQANSVAAQLNAQRANDASA